jgi:hypothetical protein
VVDAMTDVLRERSWEVRQATIEFTGKLSDLEEPAVQAARNPVLASSNRGSSTAE